MKHTLIISGSGGQGVMSIGKMLAASACSGGYYATYLPLYGPEQRGGSAKCTVVISDEPVLSPLPRYSDSLIVMNDSSAKKFMPDLKRDGLLVRNFGRVTLPPRTDVRVLNLKADEIALELGDLRAANLAMIGAMLGYTDVLPEELFLQGLEEKFAAKGEAVLELNRRAFAAGLALGRKKHEQEIYIATHQ